MDGADSLHGLEREGRRQSSRRDEHRARGASRGRPACPHVEPIVSARIRRRPTNGPRQRCCAADRPGVLERSQATPMGATGVERVRCVRPAQVVTVTSDRGGWPDASTPNRVHTSTGVRGLPVSAGGDHSRGPLVPPLRLVLSAHRGAGRAGPSRSTTSRDRWFVDEIYVKVAGRWRYLYRAVDQYGQVIDVLPSEQRDTAAARRFFSRALSHGPAPVEVTTNKAGPCLQC